MTHLGNKALSFIFIIHIDPFKNITRYVTQVTFNFNFISYLCKHYTLIYFFNNTNVFN